MDSFQAMCSDRQTNGISYNTLSGCEGNNKHLYSAIFCVYANKPTVLYRHKHY